MLVENTRRRKSALRHNQFKRVVWPLANRNLFTSFSSAAYASEFAKTLGAKAILPIGSKFSIAQTDAVLLIADDFELYLLPAAQTFLDKDLLDAPHKRPLEGGYILRDSLTTALPRPPSANVPGSMTGSPTSARSSGIAHAASRHRWQTAFAAPWSRCPELASRASYRAR
jgi:hypothetical protein